MFVFLSVKILWFFLRQSVKIAAVLFGCVVRMQFLCIVVSSYL